MSFIRAVAINVFLSIRHLVGVEYLNVGLIDCWAFWLHRCKASESVPKLASMLLSVSMCMGSEACECAVLCGGAPQDAFSPSITKGRWHGQKNKSQFSMGGSKATCYIKCFVV